VSWYLLVVFASDPDFLKQNTKSDQEKRIKKNSLMAAEHMEGAAMVAWPAGKRIDLVGKKHKDKSDEGEKFRERGASAPPMRVAVHRHEHHTVVTKPI
jgi:hypothetical protein